MSYQFLFPRYGVIYKITKSLVGPSIFLLSKYIRNTQFIIAALAKNKIK